MTSRTRYRIVGETAAQRSTRFTEELDAVDRMTEPELRREVDKLAAQADFLGVVARTAKYVSQNHCGRCPYPAGCVVCDL